VAEDNATNRIVILAQLAKLGYKAEAVGNGAEAVEAVRRGDCALVLMDCQMPVMDGFTATRTIRDSLVAKIPIIALTASAMVADRERCLRSGMDDYLAKPVDLGNLGDMVAKWLTFARTSRVARALAMPAAEKKDAAVIAVFDIDSLLDRIMGDRRLAGIVTQGFLGDAPTQLDQLRVRIEALDAPGTRLQAHTLKGSAATVGAETLRKAAQELEMAAADAHMDRCRELLPRLNAEYERFRQAAACEPWITTPATETCRSAPSIAADKNAGIEEMSDVQA